MGKNRDRAGKKVPHVLSEPVGLELEPIPPKKPGRNRPNQTARQKVLARDKNVCQYCGGYATTVDHVVPRAKGGSNGRTNLVAACEDCNHKKADNDHIRPRNWRKDGKR